MSDQFWWYLTRSSGLVAWALLTLAVLFGLVVRTKVGAAPARPPWWLDLHRFLGALATLFTGVHLVTLVADSYVDFGVLDLLVPGASEWRPVATALGVVSLWLLLAVEVTSLAQKRLPRAWWRRIHLTSYPLFWFATFHFIAAGTDSGSLVAIGAIFVAVGGVLFFTLTRAFLPGRRSTTGHPRRVTPQAESMTSG